jgi:hypothetical protein
VRRTRGCFDPRPPHPLSSLQFLSLSHPLLTVNAICSPWWWYIMEVTPSNRYPSNRYSSIHQRALDSRKRSVSQLPYAKQRESHIQW